MPNPLDELIAEQPVTEDTTTITQEFEAPVESPIDDLDKQVADREWTVVGDLEFIDRKGAPSSQHWEKIYVQEPLGYLNMMQFTGLIGQRVAEIMSGPDAVSIERVMAEIGDIEGIRQKLTDGDFSGLDAIVQGLARLAAYAPGLIEDCQCIWLRVPFNERPIVKEIWARSPAKGGLTMDDGEEMLDTFLLQNYEEVESFFSVRLPRQYKKWRERRSNAGAQRRSKR